MVALPVKIDAIGLDGTEKIIDMFPDAKCDICGHNAGAMWCGKKTIFICSHCAVSVLPQLIADAILSDVQVRDYSHLLQEVEKAKSAFWQAATCRSLCSRD
jgi:hypothetical protein